MEKSFDLACREFSESLLNLINGSGLPLTAVGYMINEVNMEIRMQLERKITAERMDSVPKEEDDGKDK